MALLDWLRWPQKVRWSWPRPAWLQQREERGEVGAPALLQALEFTSRSGDELLLANGGAGAAADIAITAITVGANGEGEEREGILPFLGGQASYVVTLEMAHAVREPVAPGRWVHLRWTNHDGEAAEWWGQADPGSQQIRPVSAPVGSAR